MTKRKTMLPKKFLCTTISTDHVRTIYETPQAIITVKLYTPVRPLTFGRTDRTKNNHSRRVTYGVWVGV